ncbi:MAG: DoxX family protein [Paludibacter sp.]
MKTIKKLLITDQNSWSLLLVRLALGITIFPHGAQKALGLFGGYGFTGTIGYFESMGMPFVLATLVILAEFVGSLGLIAGIGTRFMVFSLFIEMTGAMILGGHIHNGFFMNWYMLPKTGEGIEYFILVLGIALAVLIGGSGKFSFDNLISKKLK